MLAGDRRARTVGAVLLVAILLLPASLPSAAAWKGDTHLLIGEGVGNTHYVAGRPMLDDITWDDDTVIEDLEIPGGTCVEPHDASIRGHRLTVDYTAGDLMSWAAEDADRVDHFITEYGRFDVDFRDPEPDIHWDEKTVFGVKVRVPVAISMRNPVELDVCLRDPLQSQQVRHAYNPLTGVGSADHQARKYYDLAMEAFSGTDPDPQLGFYYLALGAHYVQDMGVTHHTLYDVGDSVFFEVLQKGCGYAGKSGWYCFDSDHDIWELWFQGKPLFVEDAVPDDLGVPDLPQLDAPEDYVRALAWESYFLGDAIDAALLARGTSAGAAAVDALGADRLHKATVYASGYVLHGLNQLADLTIVSVDGATANNVTTVTVQVRNDGALDSPDTRLRIGDTRCSATQPFNLPVCLFHTRHTLDDRMVQVAHNTTQTVTFTFDPALPSDEHLWAVLDPVEDSFREFLVSATPPGAVCFTTRFGCLLEGKEALGFSSAPMHLATPVRVLPDLAVERDDVRRDWQAETLHVTVHNEGTGAATNVRVDVLQRLGGGSLQQVQTATVASLAAGASTTLDLPYGNGLGAPVVRLDPLGAVEEADDVANNEAAVDEWVVSTYDHRGAGTTALDRDLVVRSGATLNLQGTTLALSGAPTIRVEPGATLDLEGVTVSAPGQDYRLLVDGTLRAQGGTLQAPPSGVLVRGGTVVADGTTFQGSGGRVLTAVGGTVDLTDATVTGPAALGVAVTDNARLTTTGTTFQGLDAAVHVDTAEWDSTGDTFLDAGAAIRTSGAASVWLEGATLDLEATQSLDSTVVDASSGYASIRNSTVAADRLAQGTGGRVRYSHSTGTAAELADASGDLELRLLDTSVPTRQATLADDAFVLVEWPVDLTLRSQAPDLFAVPGAALTATDALGTQRLSTSVTLAGTWSGILPEVALQATGALQYSPYTLTTQDNGPVETSGLTVAGPVTADVPVRVLPDLMAVGLDVNETSGGDALTLTVLNTEAATAVAPAYELSGSGGVLASGTLPDVGPFEAVTVDVPTTLSGLDTLTLSIDPAGAIAEVEETDNAMQRDIWIVRGEQSCTTAQSVTGTVYVAPGATLTGTGCDIVLPAAPADPSRLLVAVGGALELTGGGLGGAGDPFTAYVLGSLTATDASFRDGQLQSVGGSVHLDGVTWRSPLTPSLIVLDGSVLVEGTTMDFQGATAPVGLLVGDAVVRDSTLRNATGAVVTVRDTTGTELRNVVLDDAPVGMNVHNATVRLVDSTLGAGLTDSMEVRNGVVHALATPVDPERLVLDAGSQVRQAWHVHADVTGADAEAVAGAVVRVRDGRGQLVGEFLTGPDGRTADLELLEVAYTDVDGDLRVLQPAETVAHTPHVLESGGDAAILVVDASRDVSFGQDYAASATDRTGYQQVAPGTTASYTVRVRNLGNGEDTVALAVADTTDGWSAGVSPASAVLAPNAYVDATVTLTAPSGNDEPGRTRLVAASEDAATFADAVLSAKTGPNDAPTAGFVASPLGGYVGDTVRLTSTAADPDGFIADWTWTVSDGRVLHGDGVDLVLTAKGSLDVTLTATDNAGATATFQRTLQVFNRAPELSGGGVTPTLGTPSDAYTFHVDATDPDGEAPTVQVFAGGVWYDMSPADGRYEATVSGLAAGTHEFQFRATDAAGAGTDWPAFPAPGPVVDHRPVLSAFSATPAVADLDEPVTYTVRYTDADGQRPTSLTLQVDGRSVPLSLRAGESSRADGVYEARVLHDEPGEKTVRVEASDGQWTVSSGDLAGPRVRPAGTVSGTSLEPARGTTGTTFRFETVAAPHEGVAATSASLVLDGVAHAMDRVAGTDTFAVELTGLSGGDHEHHVEVTYPQAMFRVPGAGEVTGPTVNADPVLSVSATPASAPTGTSVSLSLAGTSDPDHGLSDLRFRVDWGDGTVSAWTQATSHAHRYTVPGTYDVTVDALDPLGGADAETVPVTATDEPPTARFVVTPGTGQASTEEGGGTPFLFLPGASADVEDRASELEARWDFDGDGAWDTAWTPLPDAATTHVYALPDRYEPALEVRDTALQADTMTRVLYVDGERPLDFGAPGSGELVEQGQQHFYRFEVPSKHVFLSVAVDAEAVAGSDLDLFVAEGDRPDPSACSATVHCVASRSRATGGDEEVCVRLPPGGTYYALVQTHLHPGTGSVGYDVSARLNDPTLSTSLLQCAAFT